MHELDRCGELSGTAEDLSRIGRCSTVEFVQAATQLQTTKAADVTVRNGVYHIVNRRMAREYKERKLNALRQARFRRNANTNGHVTPEKLEVRDQKLEEKNKVEPDSVEQRPNGSNPNFFFGKESEKPGKLNGAQIVVHNQELERVNKRMCEIRSRYESGSRWTDEDRATFAKLKARREELRKMLGVVV